MQPMRYESSDGLEIPAYVTLPKGVPAKNLPVVIVPHGGPWARDMWGYSGLPQFLANRGYAVLQMNFRGSTGYGKQFLDKGNGEWGRKMQDDVTWGVKALVQKGIADPKRVAIMGGSYGGYATLAGVAYTPDVYAAAVSIVGPSNLITLLDSIPPYWESFKKTMYARMADPGTPEGKKRLEEMSPLNYAKNIKTPLMIMQGANDPRVNKAESEQIVVALRDRGFPVEYILFPDEGHGFARPVNSLASMAAAEQFLAKRIGGRVQEGGTPAALARLKEVTVDVKTVSLAKKVETGAVGLPKIAAPPAAGLDRYAAKIKLGAQEMALEISTEIKSEGGKLVAMDTMKTPMGEVKMNAELDAATLSVTRVMVNQGPMSVDLKYADGKATGQMSVGAGPKTVEVETGGPIFADTAGASQSIASLPLAEGYEALYRNFDLQKQKAGIRKVKVLGSEQVTVPAGTFDTFKVEVTSVEGPEKTTFWVAKKERKSVKMESLMPQMNGALMTAELQK
jgi:dienelactone hydrolase